MDTAEALRPINSVFQLFGLSVIAPCKLSSIPSDRMIKCYSLLCIALRICVFFYPIGTKHFHTRADGFIHELSTTFDVTLLCGVRLLEIIIVFEAFAKIPHEKQLMRNFLEIDHIFMHYFNIDLKPNALRMAIIKRFIVWVCSFGVIVGVNLYLASNHTSMFLYYSTYAIPFATASFAYFQIIAWADLIRYRLRITNRLISTINNECEKMLHKKCGGIIMLYKSHSIHGTVQANVFEQFRIICSLYDRLWTQTNLVNERFKFAMVLNIGNDFVLLVMNIYFTFECLRCHPSAVDTVIICFLSAILNIFHLTMISRTCHHTSDEATLIAHAIHKNSMVINNKRFSSFVSEVVVIATSLMYPNKHLEKIFGNFRFRFKISHCNCFTRNCDSTRLDSFRSIIRSYLW